MFVYCFLSFNILFVLFKTMLTLSYINRNVAYLSIFFFNFRFIYTSEILSISVNIVECTLPSNVIRRLSKSTFRCSKVLTLSNLPAEIVFF